MRVVVDTNVVAYYLLDTPPFVDECKRFWRAIVEPIAPAFWEAELVNVLWMAVRKDVIDAPEALKRLDLATSLGVQSIAVANLWHGALIRAYASGLAAYDTLFVELAEREAIPLATFDDRVLKAFPALAMRPGKLIAP